MKEESRMSNEQLAAEIKAGNDVSGNMLLLYGQIQAYIRTIAVRYQGQAEQEDLMQEGFLALYPAVAGYNPDSGCRFLTYAEFWIKQYMRKCIQHSGAVRMPSHEAEKLNRYRKLAEAFGSEFGRKPNRTEIGYLLGMSIRQVEGMEQSLGISRMGSLDAGSAQEDGMAAVEIAGQDNVEEEVLNAVEQEQLRNVLWPIVDALPDRQPAVLHARYEKGLTLRAAGRELGVTGERVRVIENEAMCRIRRSPAAGQLHPFIPQALPPGPVQMKGGETARKGEDREGAVINKAKGKEWEAVQNT